MLCSPLFLKVTELGIIDWIFTALDTHKLLIIGDWTTQNLVSMFYLLIFFSIYWCLFPTEIEENSICLSYYNLAEPYSEGLFSDVYYISDVNSCRIGNVTSQMVSAFPAIEGEQKGLLIKWFNNMVNIR